MADLDEDGQCGIISAMDEKPEILLVEDERIVRKSFRALLEADGFAVREARDGAAGVAAFAERRPDLVILDVMMPKLNGLQACAQIRARDALVPILFLTGVPSETTQLRAYGVGEDDYVEKATNPDLLLAKVRAAVRRGRAVRAQEAASRRISLGVVEVDALNLEIFVSGRSVGRLTKTEGDILRALAARRGETLTADALIAALRGTGFACSDAMLYVHVSNLRRKLGPASGLLTSARGLGYTLLA